MDQWSDHSREWRNCLTVWSGGRATSPASPLIAEAGRKARSLWQKHYSPRYFFRMATATACSRVRAPSLRRAFFRCSATVGTVISNFSAISAALRPDERADRISTSRAVNELSLSPGDIQTNPDALNIDSRTRVARKARNRSLQRAKRAKNCIQFDTLSSCIGFPQLKLSVHTFRLTAPFLTKLAPFDSIRDCLRRKAINLITTID